MPPLKKIFSITSYTLALLLCSCSSVSKEKCQTTNWEDSGKKDGIKGLASEKILATEKKCSKKGFEFPIADYKKGWLEGISIYCSPQNGFKLASENKSIKTQNCPIELRPQFEHNISLGKKYLDIKSKMGKLEKQKISMKNKRSDVKSKIIEIENELNQLTIEKDEISQKFLDDAVNTN